MFFDLFDVDLILWVTLIQPDLAYFLFFFNSISIRLSSIFTRWRSHTV